MVNPFQALKKDEMLKKGKSSPKLCSPQPSLSMQDKEETKKY